MNLMREADYLPSLNKITDKVKALLGEDYRRYSCHVA